MIDIEQSVEIARPAPEVFAYIDDIRNLARHMSDERSMALMGSRLDLAILSKARTGVGAVYRYTGRVLGLRLDFTEEVTDYVPGRTKSWRTLDPARLLIVERYVMRILVVPLSPLSARLTIGFSYDEPAKAQWRWIGRLLARPYGLWCVGNMLRGAKQDLEAGTGDNHAVPSHV